MIITQGKGMISVNLSSTVLGTWFQEKKNSEPWYVSFCGIQGGNAISSGFHLLVSPSSISLFPTSPIKKRWKETPVLVMIMEFFHKWEKTKELGWEK